MRRAVIFLMSILVLSFAATASAQEYAVIVNRSNPVETISMTDLRKIVLAEVNHWARDSKPISVLVTKTEQPGTLQAVCSMTEKDLRFHIMRAKFNGQSAQPPTVLVSAAKVKETVVATAGAIGIILASDADGSVKILKISGLAPGESGYPVSLKTP